MQAGESEYWFAMIKVVMILFFIIVGRTVIVAAGARPCVGPFNASEQLRPITFDVPFAPGVNIISSCMTASLAAITIPRG